MMGGDSARKGKDSKRTNASSSSSEAPTSVEAVIEGEAAAGAAASAEAGDKQKKKTKRTKRRRSEENDCARQVTVSTNEAETGRGSKRRKKEGPEPSCASIAPAAPGFTCTSKVAEYAVGGTGSGTSTIDTAAASAQDANKKKKKKKKKAKKDKREKNSSGRSPPLGHDGNRAPPTVGQAHDRTSDTNDAMSNDDVDDNQLLEGIVHEGAMYLVDARRRVFSALRDERGNLVEVGTFDDERGKVTMVDKAPPPGGPAEGNMSGVPSDPDPATSSVTEGGGGKKKKKKKRVKEAEVAEGDGRAAVVDYPFEVEECDHCETSEQAYADIAPLLSALAASLGKAPQDLMIYDPYYCQGSTVARLASLGFPRVHNRKEDFYEVVEKGNIPDHDVVVTNPPFSGEHVPKILDFCARQGAKPWFLLLPNYVYLKDYYEPCLGRGSDRGTALPFYLTPAKRYMFYSPQGSRLKVKSSERKTSPFNTFWYIHLGNGATTSKILQAYDAVSRKTGVDARCCVARTTQQIPYKMMDSNDPRRKKARDRQRSIDRIRKKKSEWVVG